MKKKALSFRDRIFRDWEYKDSELHRIILGILKTSEEKETGREYIEKEGK